MEALLNKLSIEPAQSKEALLEKLEETNLELLERIQSCSDDNRIVELKQLHAEVEEALESLSMDIAVSAGGSSKGNMGLSEQAPASMEQTAAATTSAEMLDQEKINKSMALYRAGNFKEALDGLMPYAKQGRNAALLVCGDCFFKLKEMDMAKRMFFLAAEQGDSYAMILLSKCYFNEGAENQALDLAYRAKAAGNPEANRWLAKILEKHGKHDEAYDSLRGDLGKLYAYDRHVALLEMENRMGSRLMNLESHYERNQIINKMVGTSVSDEEREMLERLRERFVQSDQIISPEEAARAGGFKLWYLLFLVVPVMCSKTIENLAFRLQIFGLLPGLIFFLITAGVVWGIAGKLMDKAHVAIACTILTVAAHTICTLFINGYWTDILFICYTISFEIAGLMLIHHYRSKNKKTAR